MRSGRTSATDGAKNPAFTTIALVTLARCRIGPDAGDVQHVVRCERARPADICGCGPAPDAGCNGRALPPGKAGHEGRPDGGAPL